MKIFIYGITSQEYKIIAFGLCTLHQPRHVRVLAWLDPDCTRGATMSKGKGMLAEGWDL